MTVLNVKIHSKRLLCVLAAAAVTAAVLCAAAAVLITDTPHTALSPEIGEYSLEVGESGEKDFLRRLGYTPSDRETETEQVTIPSSFNARYEQYNEQQKHAGLDLSKFCGRVVEKRTVWLENPENVKAVLLVYEGLVIGGHLSSGEYGSMDLPLI